MSSGIPAGLEERRRSKNESAETSWRQQQRALLGALQFTVSAAAGALVGALHNGPALPMAGVITLCCVAALVGHRTLAAAPAFDTSSLTN